MSKQQVSNPASDTVIILGAGFSCDAGIPLMAGFVDRMWELAIRKRLGKVALSSGDAAILEEAMRVRLELNDYHGRAAFDDRNIEDILSILSFNEFVPKPGRKSRLASVTRAIGRTIELSCTVKHPGVQPGRGRVVSDGPDQYRQFWSSLFKLHSEGIPLPTLITLNYDLVLERSLLQVLIGTSFNQYDKRFPAQRIRVAYHHDGFDDMTFQVGYVDYDMDRTRRTGGTVLEPVPYDPKVATVHLDILKLHGSLNFPAPRTESARDHVPSLTKALDEPFIMPPIFNKQSTAQHRSVWRVAMERLRVAKHVIVVGYSLPRTDIYMQYFLKAALGPNIDLSRIFVFDPALYAGKKAGEEMKARYADCFAPQLQDRICFRPSDAGAGVNNSSSGTTIHFVDALTSSPGALVF